MKANLTKYTVIAMATLIFAGCAGRNRPSDETLGWPPPPQEPKIIYVESIYGSNTLSRSFLGKIRDFFFGRAAQFSIGKPYGVTKGNNGRLYLADTSRKGILEIDRESGKIKFFNSLGRYGTLVEPIYTISDTADNIYVSDTQLGKVVVFNRELKFVRFIGGPGVLERPVGMALNPAGDKLYVVDTKLHQVVIFDLKGEKLGTIGRKGDDQGEFHFPLTLAFSQGGDTLYVVDSFHFAVQAFDKDGLYLFSFGPSKVGTGTMARPRDIAIDSQGNLYVTDAMYNNVQVYDNKGTLLLRFGQGGIGPGQFRLPAGIFIDDQDNIYLSDSVNGRIQIFKFVG